MPIKKFLTVALFAAAAVMAAEQEQPTPYDLIRPVYPLTWDTTVFDHYDTTVTTKHNMVPKNRTPASYVPNALIPDTLNQAYLDAINYRMSPIRINQAGYLESDPEKQFYYIGTASTFEVVDVDGKSLNPMVTGELANSGQQTSSDWTIIAGTNAATNDQKRYQVDITGQSGIIQVGRIPGTVPTETRLRIKVGNDISSTFIVSNKVYTMVKDAALKFYGINRSGYGDSWFHPASHTLDGGASSDSGVYSFDQSLAGTLEGGYYDCGDHLKESQTQMYAFMVAALMAATNADADEDHYAFNHGETVNRDGIPDMLREAKHGADFVLRAYKRAKGVIDDMALSVGDFGSDHGWWGRPESQDKLPLDPSRGDPALRRGGPLSRTVRLGEIGANIGGETAAGLAILSKMYAEYDKPFADSCLKVAREMYKFGKDLAQGKTFTHNKKAAEWSSPAYNGNNEFVDDMALASVALLYATGEKQYADDMIRNTNMYTGQPTNEQDGPGYFKGGWFVSPDKGFLKNGKNTSWANSYAYATYALYKLILADENKAINEYGLTADERLNAIEDCIVNMIFNLGDVSKGTATIVLPKSTGWNGIGWKMNEVKYDPIWYSMQTDQDWIYNRYQAGNIFEVLAYADVAKDIEKQNLTLPNMGDADWKADEMHQLAINQLNYLLGVNPWDVSYILGIGDKNDAHPHHRAANPEGKNMPGASYKYRPPVGALYGGVVPGTTNSMVPDNKSWEDYHKSETCIDAAATLVSSGMLAAAKFDRTAAPGVSVEIRHVSMDSAIVMVKLSTRGNATIYYGTAEGSMTTTATSDENKSGVQHEIVLRGLTNGTAYYFYVEGQNAYNTSNVTYKYMVDSTKTPFSFTTLNSVESAQIANVTVCNMLGDSAEIMWYTPNGEYESKVYWDTVPHTTAAEYAFNSGSGNADVSGIPTKFHYVKIGGLKEQTTYYYMVESNGQFANTDEKTGDLLKFTTPVGWYDFSVRAYQYEFDNLQNLNLNIYNNESRPFDSLELRLYFTALPEEVDNCAFLIDTDILQAYDEAGFNHPLLDKDGIDVGNDVRKLMRNARPHQLQDTYDAATGKYSYYFPVPLGGAEMKSASRIRLDFAFSYGISNDGFKTCETLRQPPKKVLNAKSGDWSWAPHEFLVDGADYDGMPEESKDYGDMDVEIAINPYITVYRKDEFIWGYSPSYQEMTTKRAHYEMDVSLDAPFNVSNNSYVQIDQTSSTVFVKGYAHVSEGGFITRIWANGTEIDTYVKRIGKEILLLRREDNLIVAHYNVTSGGGEIDSTGLWSLNIPVKMKIGSNKVDLTIFAGADPECAECAENGGCAFINRTYYVQFTRGNLTASSLTIKREDGSPVSVDGKPVDPENTQFYIYLTDKDKANTSSTINVLVINNKKADTLKVKMIEDSSNPGTFKSEYLISAVSVPKEGRVGNQISFFAGDTIQVIYIDPDDEEDVSKQSFYAESKYPEPQKVLAQDTDCDNIADKLLIEFSNVLEAAYSFDSISVYLPGMSDTVTLKVDQSAALNNSEVLVDLPQSLGIKETAAPTGMSVVYLKAEGATNIERVPITDGILPRLLSFTILENPEPRSVQDTLMVAFTEPVLLASLNTWFYEVDGASVDISVVGKATTSNDGKSWLYVVTGNTEGKILPVGGQVRVKASSVADKAFNYLDPASGCKDNVKIVETPKPVPVTLAEMRDKEGDGYVDELYMKFEKKLRDKDMLDSFVVEWGKKPEVLSFKRSDSNWVHTKEFSQHWQKTSTLDSTTGEVTIDSVQVSDTISIISIPLTPSNTFAYGTTNGPYDGYGRVTPRLGPEGGFFDKYYSVVDKCPPIILSAIWQGYDVKNDESQGSQDYVTLTFSEPLDTVGGHSAVVERFRDGEPKVIFDLKASTGLSLEYTPNTTTARLGYRHKNEKAIWIADSVRLISDEETSVFKDQAGMFAGYGTPWVPVAGSVSNIKFSISMAENVARGRNADSVYYGGQALLPDENFRLTAETKDKETVVIAAGESKLKDVFSAPIKDYRHAGPVFVIEIALPDVKDSTENGEPKRNYEIKLEVDLFTNMGAYINRASYEFTSESVAEYISASSTLTLNLEWCAPEDYPLSAGGKKIGTGPYIAKFATEAMSEYLPKEPDEGDRTEKLKESDAITKTFGFRRTKK
ncbi:glycoside hydrolase family 9 protein [uncultured Fibrobacter sp.]|uniref:glycoside hydrolase family 9 protein n=1 Tax=uncultured Fibrobacter sp. TaxID=261512 RepID=UPI00262F6EAE|nr:glycoside hydrolase family 9 protein [uncultured Fibrobacter sp.]